MESEYGRRAREGVRCCGCGRAPGSGGELAALWETCDMCGQWVCRACLRRLLSWTGRLVGGYCARCAEGETARVAAVGAKLTFVPVERSE
ncbi:MAG: hypothetical protein QJR08_03710 [Bacillota bacterium]|nr:hypothetical protein [Bacillota bacterium]